MSGHGTDDPFKEETGAGAPVRNGGAEAAEAAAPAEPDPAPPPEDPLLEDPRAASEPRALVERINDCLDDLEWRVVARNKQARAMAVEADLAKTAAELYAERQAKAPRSVRKVPDSPQAAKRVLGRLLAKCEGAMDEILDHGQGADEKRPGHQFSLATQLAHAAAHLARTMDQLGAGTRHTVRVERKGAPGSHR